MGVLYDFYERRVFPPILDWAMRAMDRMRPEALSSASGDVLEIGFGTGRNLRHYPASVTRLSTADPMDALPGRVGARIAAAPFPVERHHLPADGGLPFDAGRFDCVTVTWTLCTIPDPVAALEEARRVLRPGGRLLFIEHGRSRDPRVARWQDRWNPVQQRLACGCNVNRPVDALIERAGFAVTDLDHFEMEGVPRLFGTTYRGEAVPAA